MSSSDRSSPTSDETESPASVTRASSRAATRHASTALVAWSILIFFAFLGQALLKTLGISLASFRIAGGIMLFIIALEMVFEKRTERREGRERDSEAERVGAVVEAHDPAARRQPEGDAHP